MALSLQLKTLTEIVRVFVLSVTQTARTDYENRFQIWFSPEVKVLRSDVSS